jgi:hypothetical protein
VAHKKNKNKDMGSWEVGLFSFLTPVLAASRSFFLKPFLRRSFAPGLRSPVPVRRVVSVSAPCVAWLAEALRENPQS